MLFKHLCFSSILWCLSQATPVSIEDSIRLAKAQEILKYMKENVNPCEDFYEFACGNYALYNPASQQNPSTGLIQTLQDQLELKIKEILSSPEYTGNRGDKNLKRFYKSCLNLGTLQNSYPEKLREIIGEFGQMPVLEGLNWQAKNFDWLSTVANIAFRYDIRILVDLDIAVDFADNTMNRLYVSEEDFGLTASLYREQDNLLITTAYMTLYLGIPLELSAKTAKEIIELEKALIKATVGQQTNVQLKELFSDLTTIDQVHDKYWPDLDFKQLVGRTWGSLPSLWVYVDNAYLRNLIGVLKATPPATVTNYIFFKLISAFIVDLPNTKAKLQEVCIAQVKKNFYKNLDNLVYRKYNTKENEEIIHNMWMNIKSTFLDVLESPNLLWLGEDTRKYAVEKLKSMKFEILSYGDTRDDIGLQDLYPTDQDYIENLKHILSAKAFQRRQLNYAVAQKLKTGLALSTTPAYTTLENTVKVPVALLQPHYAWSPYFPNAFNFGILGSLLSHELLHAFDSGGRLYDAQGNIGQWWDDYSSYEFDLRSKCFSQQYHQYIFGGQRLHEIANQNENIADNGGVRLSYRAYLNWYHQAVGHNRKNPLSESLEGVRQHYNHKQLFFISYAHLWCSDLHSDYWSTILNSYVHVPTRFRVIGPLSNFKEFSQAFNCPAGSAMNPLKKCEIY